jgi:hypothetical protein
MLLTQLEGLSFSRCVNGDRRLLGFGLVLLETVGAQLAIFQINIAHLLVFWTSRWVFLGILPLAHGTILICLKWAMVK